MRELRHGFPGLLLAALLTSAVFVALPPGAAVAQSGFSVPAGPLDQALAVFGRQADLQISYDPAIVAGLRSSGLNDTLAAPDALRSLLSGTGLQHRRVGGKTVVIERAARAAVAGADGVLLEEVVLYGDRTATTLGESRASVAVVRATPDAAPAPATIRDAFRQMANVTGGDMGNDGFIIRGINSEGLVPGAGGAPLASVYIDGVQQTIDGARRGTRGFFDVEQVEVYRGPQSTLSGRAALAGALYVRTVDPEFARSGAAQLSFGSDNRKQVGLAFGDQLGANLAYRISGEWSRKDSDLDMPGYAHYPLYDQFRRDEYRNLRAKLLWLPTGDDTTRVLFSAARSYDNPNDRAIMGPNWSTDWAGTPMGAPYGDLRGDRYSIADPSYAGLGFFLGLPAGMTFPTPIFEEARIGRVDNYGIEVRHELNANLRLTALTGLSRSVTERNSINFGMDPAAMLFPSEIFNTSGAFRKQTLSQELRLNYENDRLKWVAGLYAARQSESSWTDMLMPDQTQLPNLVPALIQSRTRTNSTNIALFGEAAWQFAPGWTALMGARLDHIRQSQTGWDLPAVPGAPTTFRDTVLLPKLGLSHDFANGQTLSLVYQEGYRPGGSGVRVNDGFRYSYDAERARNLELSWRGSFMDDRLRVAANLFHQDWRNQQVEILNVPGMAQSGYVVNAGRSRSTGAELDVGFAASDMLNLYGSVGLLKTRFTDFNIQGTPFNYTGLPFPNAPRSSVALGFRWGAPTGWFAAGSAKYVSGFMSRLENGIARPVDVKGRTTVDVEFGYAWDQVKLTAYATNLMDKTYLLYERGPGVEARLGAPREIGLRLDYRF